jgi:DNA gyrase subunit B
MPVKVLPRTNKPFAQSVLTEVTREEYQYFVPGGEKGIGIAVVNALSQKLTVEIRREGRIYRQEYVNGIPQTDLMAIGFTDDTGTSVTFKPNAELFGSRFSPQRIREKIEDISLRYPGVKIGLEDETVGMEGETNDGE